MNLKIINLNIESGLGITKGYYQYITRWPKWFTQNSTIYVEKAAGFIKEQNPDIVFITEIDQGSRRSGFINQVELVNSKFKKSEVFFPTTKFLNFWNQGSAILTSHQITSTKNHILPGKGERRVLGEVNIKINGAEVVLYVVHIGLKKLLRSIQYTAIVDIIAARKEPIILAGDFNTTDLEELKPIFNIGLRKYITDMTYPSWKPFRNLDYIFLSDHFEITNYSTYKNELFSDHLPLSSNISLKS